jgi:hypothetical protein
MAALLGVELAPGTPILPIISPTFWSMAEELLVWFGPQAVMQAALRSRQRLRPLPCRLVRRLVRWLVPATRKPTGI